MRIRIYYNRMSDAPYIWSFDHGTQETERQVTNWRLFDVDAVAGVDNRVDPNDKEAPRVWIELRSVIGFDVTDDVLCVYGQDREVL